MLISYTLKKNLPNQQCIAECDTNPFTITDIYSPNISE